MTMIDDAPTEPLTLAELAEAAGLDRFQLVRGFARATGLTPHAYRLQRRIGLARRLIARGVALAEAALASGFADQSHMTRVFARTYRITPGAYARGLGHRPRPARPSGSRAAPTAQRNTHGR